MDTSTGLCQLVKRINICMDKRKKWGKNCLFFADERYLRLSKICSFGNYVTLCVLYVYCNLQHKSTNIAIEANVRTIT